MGGSMGAGLLPPAVGGAIAAGLAEEEVDAEGTAGGGAIGAGVAAARSCAAAELTERRASAQRELESLAMGVSCYWS